MHLLPPFFVGLHPAVPAFAPPLSRGGPRILSQEGGFPPAATLTPGRALLLELWGWRERASAPPTTSRISWVISACRALFMARVRSSISSPAFFEALRIAVIRAPCSEAADSSRAR